MSSKTINYDDFQYVVERKKPDKVCFGSGVVRNTSPIGKGLSPFQKRMTFENFEKVDPQTYNLSKFSAIYQLLHKVRSTKGVGNLVSEAPRFSYRIVTQIPSPTRYNLRPKWGTKIQSKSPFGTSTSRGMRIYPKTPGPGNYPSVDCKCFMSRFDYNFGVPSMVPAVEAFCVSKIVDKCEKCKELCQGDYWHRNYSNYLCHLCWLEEHHLHDKYSDNDLKEFTKIRNCSFMHSHEGTTAAVRLKPWNKIIKQIRLENYLNLFLKC